MKNIFKIVIVFILLFSSSLVFAQQELLIENVIVELLPEYDRNEILIVYTVSLFEGLEYPVDISVNIPASSGEPSMVWEVVDGQPVETTYDLVENGDWISVNIKTETPVIYIDFYDPSFRYENLRRSYSYQYPPDLVSENVRFSFRQPVQTEVFQASITFQQSLSDEFGNIFHFIDLDQDELEDFQVDFSYNAIEIVENENNLDLSWQVILPWILGFIGFGLIAFGIYNSYFENKPRKSKRKRNSGRKQDSSKTMNAGFCHNCGNRLSKTDKFCPDCGEKAR